MIPTDPRVKYVNQMTGYIRECIDDIAQALLDGDEEKVNDLVKVLNDLLNEILNSIKDV